MLGAMGRALFVLEGERAMMSMSDLSRVIQGLAIGIGFIGAGAILKESAERKVEGLTTAAGIWMTAAAGAAARAGPGRTRAAQCHSSLGDSRVRWHD